MSNHNMIQHRAETLGLTMIDADKPIDVKITREDIQGAKAQNPANCAIARACKRQHHVENAFVFRTTVWLETKDKLVRYSLPPSLQKEVVAFDRGGRRSFAPGEYHLSPAHNAKRNAAQKRGEYPQKKIKARAKKRRARGVAKRSVHRTAGIRGTEFE